MTNNVAVSNNSSAKNKNEYIVFAALKLIEQLYRDGKIGEFEYGECEYIHNCEAFWPSITYGEEEHWRNNMYSTFKLTDKEG